MFDLADFCWFGLGLIRCLDCFDLCCGLLVCLLIVWFCFG